MQQRKEEGVGVSQVFRGLELYPDKCWIKNRKPSRAHSHDFSKFLLIQVLHLHSSWKLSQNVEDVPEIMGNQKKLTNKLAMHWLSRWYCQSSDFCEYPIFD